MPLPPAPTQRASLLATKNIAKFEKKLEPLLPLSSELASAKKPTTKKCTYFTGRFDGHAD